MKSVIEMRDVSCLSICLLLLILGCQIEVAAQMTFSPDAPEYYAMDREDIAFDDEQVLLVNYRGFISPRQYSLTQFTNVWYLPLGAPRYEFNLNFLDKGTGRLIEDDVPTKWKSWIDDGKSHDPLGSNFRPNSPSIVVTQDEKWQPNQYYRSATFHKEYDHKWVSFAAKSWTNVSFEDDEVFLKLQMTNRNSEDLNMTIIPNQISEIVEQYAKQGLPLDLLMPNLLMPLP